MKMMLGYLLLRAWDWVMMMMMENMEMGNGGTRTWKSVRAVFGTRIGIGN